MNPFSDIIDTTRVRPSILYSPSTVQKLVENLRAENNDDSDRRKTQTDENHGNYAMKLNKSSSNSDGEVYELLARLKQLVGDVNVNPILEQLNLRKQKDCATLSEQPLTLDDKNLSKEVVCTEPNKKTKLNARFALSSPKVIQDTGSNVFDDEIDDDFPSGNSTMRTEEYSRYSLGSNRFSKRASQLSSEILTYVNGNKLLRTTSRSTLLPPDPYACLSPSKGRLIKAHSTSVIPIPSETLVVDSPPENENFQEFSIIGVQSDMLCGLKSLELTSLQPTEVSSAFPADVGRQAIVSNLNEYCFPYGAELRYVNRKELDQLNALSKSDVNASGTAFHNSTHSYGLKYQIMQFTDMEGTVYYATCVISSEPLERVSPQLHANMEVLQNNIAASNMIKRYFTFFLHKKKMRENDALTAKWVSNIAKSRVNSIMTTSAETEGSSADSKGTKKTSIFKVFKRVIGIATKGNGGAAALNSSTSGGSNSEAGKGQSPVSGATRPRKLNGDGKFVSPVGSPLLRQRSRSLCEGGLRTSSADSDSSGVFAEVHVDGSPSKGKISARQINQSNKKVALLTQKAYCIISSQPLHSLFFQVLLLCLSFTVCLDFVFLTHVLFTTS